MRATSVRRLWLVFVVFMGTAVVLVPPGPASAADSASCPGEFVERLECWEERAGDGYVLVTLNQRLEIGGNARDGKEVAQRIRDRHQLVVEVPDKASTGEGGSALLALAEGLLVHPGARIDALSPETVRVLEEVGACAAENAKGTTDLCDQLGVADPVPGSKLIESGHAVDLAANKNFIVPPSEVTGQEGNKGTPAKGGSSPAMTSSRWTILAMSVLLILLLAALATLVRRSRGPVAVGHRSPAATPGPRAASPPARTPTPTPTGSAQSAGSPSGHADEATTRIRVASSTRYGRRVEARTGSARTAVVRTELHPQGYVELDRVLYRAVWAEPGRPPPAPGGLVDVTDARERETDVLYAFPPAGGGGRHAAQGTR
ncbi:hypothetical protein [Streptomyces sp. NPDC002845]